MEIINQTPEHSDANAEHAARPFRYGIPTDKLSDEIWRGVLCEYYKSVYKGYEPSEDDFLMLPVENVRPGFGLRIGSRFGSNSKLQVVADYTDKPVVSFDFQVNEDLTDSQKQESDLARETFRSNVDQFLQGSGHSEPLMK